jgi:hypothetical protein
VTNVAPGKSIVYREMKQEGRVLPVPFQLGTRALGPGKFSPLCIGPMNNDESIISIEIWSHNESLVSMQIHSTESASNEGLLYYQNILIKQ